MFGKSGAIYFEQSIFKNIMILGTQWMQRPSVPGCPPGLEYLTQVDQLLVHQAVELLEGMDVENNTKLLIIDMVCCLLSNAYLQSKPWLLNNYRDK